MKELQFPHHSKSISHDSWEDCIIYLIIIISAIAESLDLNCLYSYSENIFKN